MLSQWWFLGVGAAPQPKMSFQTVDLSILRRDNNAIYNY
jgi:hypothetical protein